MTKLAPPISNEFSAERADFFGVAASFVRRTSLPSLYLERCDIFLEQAAAGRLDRYLGRGTQVTGC